jgi:hypothetical protein
LKIFKKEQQKFAFTTGVCYEKRLEKMNLTNLVDRRLRGDFIQMYRAINNIDKISWHHEPERIGITPRGHYQKLRREKVHHSLPRHNFLTNRVVEA